MRVISRSTIASTIGGKWVSSQSFSMGRSNSRVRPSSEVSPDRTICGATPGSERVCSAEKLWRRFCALLSSSKRSSEIAFSAAVVSSRTSSSSSRATDLARLVAGRLRSSSAIIRLIDDNISSIDGSLRLSAINLSRCVGSARSAACRNRFYFCFLRLRVNGAGRFGDGVRLR